LHTLLCRAAELLPEKVLESWAADPVRYDTAYIVAYVEKERDEAAGR
jgi:hypothetical protein